MRNIAIFASGSGTNAENIIKYFAESKDISIVVVLSNKNDAGVHARAKALEVPSFTYSNADFKASSPILQKLADYKTDFIVLAGFLSMISPDIINTYQDKIVNIHPALLPKFGGKGMYGHYVHDAVVAEKEEKSGITIHYINERYDEGAIIFQAECPVLSSDSTDDVAAKVHELEYEYYPKVIEGLLK